jgi:predicted RND superfamily exporter protein
LSGESKEFRESSSSLMFAMILALLMIYLVLAAQFESFKDPLVVMFTVPLAIAGAAPICGVGGRVLTGPLASLLALTAALVLVIGPSRRLLGKLDAVVHISRAVVFERHIAAREVQRLLLIALRPAAVLIRGTPVLRPVVGFAGLSLPSGAVLLD